MNIVNEFLKMNDSPVGSFVVEITPVDKQNMYAKCLQSLSATMKRASRKVSYGSWKRCTLIGLGLVYAIIPTGKYLVHSENKIVSTLVKTDIAIFECLNCL